jgi:hypothetical protein
MPAALNPQERTWTFPRISATANLITHLHLRWHIYAKVKATAAKGHRRRDAFSRGQNNRPAAKNRFHTRRERKSRLLLLLLLEHFRFPRDQSDIWDLFASLERFCAKGKVDL